MARGDSIRAGLAARVSVSVHELTVFYPALRAVAVAPVSGAPFSPLTGAPRPGAVVPAPVTASKPPVTVKCLWQQAPALSDARPNKDRSSGGSTGWVEGATTMAIVGREQGALDPEAPFGATVFDGAEYVEHHGKRYTIIQVDTAGPSFQAPHSYTVWLAGARVQ